MLSNYFKIALRNLLRYKGFSLVNIVSLTLGIAFAMMISLWVKNEMSFNRFHANLDELYMVRTNLRWSGLQTTDSAPGPLAPTIKEEVPEVVAATRLTWSWESLLSFRNRSLKENGYYVDADFLNMFSFPVIYGDASTALIEPNSIVITRAVSEKLFGTVDPVGESLQMDGAETPFTVKAVVENVPSNSDIQFTWLAPWSNFAEDRDWVKTWGNVIFPTYVQLVKDSDLDQINEKIAFLGQAKELSQDYFLQALSEQYLYGKYEEGQQAGGRIEYVRLFSAITIFLLVIACINFMNLAPARAGRRAKEIGIRKVLGASAKGIVQLLSLDFLKLVTVALILAFPLAYLYMNQWLQNFVYRINMPWWIFLQAAVLALGIAFLTVSFQSIRAALANPMGSLKNE